MLFATLGRRAKGAVDARLVVSRGRGFAVRAATVRELAMFKWIIAWLPALIIGGILGWNLWYIL